MAWFEFRMMITWTPRPVTPASQRRNADTFRALWDPTLALLERECEYLGASLVVVEVDITDPRAFRRDGLIRADARVNFPGVIVSFESKHGPLQYATDAYERWVGGGRGLTSWQANVRAVALSLQALRAVDRYGVTHTGEQYQGWTAIAARPSVMTREQAAEFIAYWAEPDDEAKRATAVAAMLRSPELFVPQLHRRAAKRAHPDVTGDDGDTMARLNQARDIINGRNQADV